MELGIDVWVVLFFALGIMLLYLSGWLLLFPLKIILRFILNGLIGGLALCMLNLAGGVFSVNIAVNPITALAAGYFGLPGIILLLVLKIILI